MACGMYGMYGMYGIYGTANKCGVAKHKRPLHSNRGQATTYASHGFAWGTSAAAIIHTRAYIPTPPSYTLYSASQRIMWLWSCSWFFSVLTWTCGEVWQRLCGERITVRYDATPTMHTVRSGRYSYVAAFFLILLLEVDKPQAPSLLLSPRQSHARSAELYFLPPGIWRYRSMMASIDIIDARSKVTPNDFSPVVGVINWVMMVSTVLTGLTRIGMKLVVSRELNNDDFVISFAVVCSLLTQTY